MPWREVTRMSLREEFVQLALQQGCNRLGAQAGALDVFKGVTWARRQRGFRNRPGRRGKSATRGQQQAGQQENPHVRGSKAQFHLQLLDLAPYVEPGRLPGVDQLCNRTCQPGHAGRFENFIEGISLLASRRFSFRYRFPLLKTTP